MSFSRLMLIFKENQNNPPDVTLQETEKVRGMSTQFGFDLCDFITLKRDKQNRLNKKFIGNHHNYKDSLFMNSMHGTPKKIITGSDVTHPYFYFDSYDPRIDKETNIYNEEVCDWQSEKTINTAHWELSLFFDIAEEEGFSLILFQSFINNYLTLPRFSFGAISSFGSFNNLLKNFNINDDTYEKNLKIRKFYLDIDMNNPTNNMTTVYHCENLADVIVAYVYHSLKLGYIFKKCKNCGKWFIPYKRSDALYCERFAPQDERKTCKEYGRQQAYLENLEKNEGRKLYRKIYQRLQMLAHRNPDIKAYHDKFAEYKEQSKQYKMDIKEGKKSDAEFISWLKEYEN